MIFGFGLAIIIGTLLTALPSWAGTPEVGGAAPAPAVMSGNPLGMPKGLK